MDECLVLKVASLFGEGSGRHVKGMKHHVVISEEIVEERGVKSEDGTEAVSSGAGGVEGSSSRKIDQAKEYYEQKRRVTKPIALGELFKKRSLEPGVPESEVQRVLLYGNPGSGKTCITKVIAHKWALGEIAQEFDAVYVVPVRVLTSIEHKGQHWAKLETAISQICYSERECASDCEDLVAQIQDELDSPSTLLMVDGLDEANDHSKEIVSKIWGRSCKILLLSRPYNMRNVETRVDIQVECLGFNDQQLRNYIRSELSEDEAPRLISSLEKAAAMWEMAHIPVTAHILCSLSKEHDTVIQKEGRRASTFQMYNDMANYVWKRFEEKPSARNVQKSEVFGDLEKIAFEALRSGVILVHERFVMQNATSKNAARTFKESGLLLFLLEGQEYQFPHLTFQEYFAGRYIAKSLRQKGSDEETRVLDFIRQGKYNEKHALTLSFAMHAFAEKRSKHALKEMLSIVDEQPVEVLGIHHFFLRMRVLEATMEEADETDLETLACDELAIKLAEAARFLLEKTIDNVLISEIVVEEFEQWFRVMENFPNILRDTICETKTLLESSRDLTWKEEAKVKDVLKLAKHSSKHIGDIRTFLQQYGTLIDWRRRSPEGGPRFLDIAREIPQLARDLLPMLQQGCNDENSGVRKSAMHAFGSIVAAAPHFANDLLPMLQQGCGDEDPGVRRSAISVIDSVVVAAPPLADKLVSMLRQWYIDKAPGLRMSAMQAVGNIAKATPQVADKLVQMLQQGACDEDAGVRTSAILTIGSVVVEAPEHAKRLLPMLQQRCGDGDLYVSQNAKEAIGEMAKAAPQLAVDLLPMLQQGCDDREYDVRQNAMQAICEIAKAAPQLAGDLLPMLQQGCNDKEDDVRQNAMQAIGEIAKAAPQLAGDLLPMLRQGCDDKESDVRQNAMQAIGEIAEAAPQLAGDLLPMLQQRCDDKHVYVRRRVMQTIGDIAKAEPQLVGDLLPMLQQRCDDEEYYVRRRVMQAIGEIAKAAPQLAGDLLPMLQQGCNDKEDDVRQNAMQAIGKIAKAAPQLAGDLLPMLQQGCNDIEDDVRQNAMQAIGEIAKAAPQLAGDLLPMLQQRCDDKHVYVRRRVMQTIVEIAKAAPQLAGDLLPMLQQRCDDENPILRVNAISAIGDIAKAAPQLADDLLTMLQQGCNEEDSYVRRRVIQTIGDIAKAEPQLAGDLLPMLQQGCNDKKYDVRQNALLAIGDIAKAAPQLANDLLTMLQQGCNGKEYDVRQNAMQAIGSVVEAAPQLAMRLLPMLQEGCNDEAAYVHTAAKKTFDGVNVERILLSTILSTCTYEGGFLLLFMKNAFTFDSSSGSEKVRLVLHSTSSEKIGEWEKEDADKFVRQLKQEFDESFPGLSGCVNQVLQPRVPSARGEDCQGI